MFGTVLNYIALRLLGVPPEDPACSKGLAFIRENGGAVMAPSWAKFWMAVLGVYDWEVSCCRTREIYAEYSYLLTTILRLESLSVQAG